MTRYYSVTHNKDIDETGLMPQSKWDLFGFDTCTDSFFFAHDFFEHNFLDTLKVKKRNSIIEVNPNYVEHELVAMGHAFYIRSLFVKNIDFISGLNSYLHNHSDSVTFPAYDMKDFQCSNSQFTSWATTWCKDPRITVKEVLCEITERYIKRYDDDDEINHFDMDKQPLLLNYIMYWVRLGFNMAKRKYQKFPSQYRLSLMFKKLQNSSFIENIALVEGSTMRATMNFKKRTLTLTRLKDRHDANDYDDVNIIRL